MPVTRHTDLDAFIEAVAPMAARGEASASFFTGAAHAMKRLPPRPGERVYLATCHGAETFGVAMLREVGPVLIGASDPAACAAFAADLAGDRPELQGVMGARVRMRGLHAKVAGADRAREPAARADAPARARRRQRRACGPRRVEDGGTSRTPSG